MKRVALNILMAIALISLVFLTSRPASAQMMGGMMGGQGQTKRQSMGMRHNMESMQGMMQGMHAMMMQMHGMMHVNEGMMVNGGMSAKGPSSNGHWATMMQAMNSMGESMQHMLKEMNTVMSSKQMMSNTMVKSSMDAMQNRMRNIMGSMRGMLHSMERIQISQR